MWSTASPKPLCRLMKMPLPIRRSMLARVAASPNGLPTAGSITERAHNDRARWFSFLEKFSDTAAPVRTISEDAMTRLMAYDWPGNVRELENAIERAVALGTSSLLHVGDLPSNLQYGASEKLPQNDVLLPLDELERRAIMRALRESGGDKLAAARLLGIGKTTLYRKLKQYDAQAHLRN